MQWVVGPEMQVVWPTKSWWETTVSAKLWIYRTGDEAKWTFSRVSLSYNDAELEDEDGVTMIFVGLFVPMCVCEIYLQFLSEYFYSLYMHTYILHYSSEVWVSKIFFIFIQQGCID